MFNLMFSMISIQNDLNKYLNLSFIPPQYLWLVPIGFLVLGLLMLFKSVDTWRFAIAALGLIAGYFEVSHLMATYKISLTVYGTPLPPYLLPLIAGVLAAIILSLIVRFAISAALAYLIYYEMSIHLTYPLTIAVTVAIIAFGLSWFFYHKIVQVIAKAVGTVILFIGLTMLNIPVKDAAIIALVFLAIAAIWMMYKNRILARLYGWLAARKVRKANKPPKPKKVKTKETKNITDGGDKVSVVKKVLGIPKKLIPHKKEAEKAEAQETATPASVEEPVVHVRKGGKVE
jgi:hypothetical protein